MPSGERLSSGLAPRQITRYSAVVVSVLIGLFYGCGFTFVQLDDERNGVIRTLESTQFSDMPRLFVRFANAALQRSRHKVSRGDSHGGKARVSFVECLRSHWQLVVTLDFRPFGVQSPGAAA